MTPAPAVLDADPREVDPAQVERELAALWREAAESRGRLGGEVMHNRVLLHTLVVFCGAPEAAEQARAAAIALSPRLPARTLILAALPDAPDPGLEAAIALTHAPRDGDDPVCGEVVTFTARGAQAVRRLPGAVLPLLLTNLPSFLWWHSGSPFDHPALTTLAPAIDRLIVDSVSFADPARDLSTLDRAIADDRFHAVISDLVWARLAPWRYHTAQAFDSALTRPFLDRLRRVGVRYQAGPPLLAWLYGGWLAARLHWAAIGRAAERLRFEGGQEVHFEALETESELGPGSFVGARLEAENGAVVQISRLGSAHAAIRLALGGPPSERVVALRAETLDEWLGHELGRLAPVPTYEAAIHLLASAR